MSDEITVKDLYDIIDKRFNRLEEAVEKYHDAFVRFEEGKLTQALQDIEKNKGEILLLQETINKSKTTEEVNAEKRKDRVWSTIEKIIFMLILPTLGLIGSMLIKLGIIHLN